MRSFRRTSVASRNPVNNNVNNRTEATEGSEGASPFHADQSSTKHISISYAACDPTLVYESVVLFFSLSAFFLQLLHLYRTVWWLPQSYTQYAVV